MRFLCFSLALASYVVLGLAGHGQAQTASLPSVSVTDPVSWREAAALSPEPEVRALFHEIERLTVRNDSSGCDALQPIPLDASLPSVGDWTTYCRARVERNPAACASIPATIVPDLRRLCQNDSL